ncbi:MAG: hypothetical protein QOF66_6090 [Mycobacterium sp.]|jgi:hypothetical protein|nr:hypothetical protein [Mycobacterium sp.]
MSAFQATIILVPGWACGMATPKAAGACIEAIDRLEPLGDDDKIRAAMESSRDGSHDGIALRLELLGDD